MGFFFNLNHAKTKCVNGCELFNDKNIFKIKDTLLLLNKKPELININSKYSGEHNIDAPKN